MGAFSRRAERAVRVLPECVTTVPPPPPSRLRLRRRPPAPGAGLPSAGPAARRPPRGRARAARPCCSASSDHLEPQLQRRRRQLGELRPERRRSRAGSAVGSRSVTVRRHEAPPTSRAQRASFRGGRPARSGRASRRSTSTPSPRRSVSSWPTASGNSSVSTSGSAGRRRRDPPVLLASRQAPGAPAVRPQSFGDGAARQPGKLSDRSYPKLLELLVALALEREQRAAAAARGTARAVVGDDQRLPRPRDVRRRERREAPLGRPRACIPRRPDRRERPLERRLEPAVEPLDPSRLEEDRARPRPARPRSPRPRAGAGSPPTPARPSPDPARRARAAGRSRAPRRAASPAARPSPPPRPVTEPTQRLRPRQRRERRRLRLRAPAGGAAPPADRRPG